MTTLSQPNATRVSFKEAGQGRLLILLHGFPLDHEMWAPQLAALQNSTHVLALDAPGFGNSAPLSSFTIDSVADHLAAFLTAQGITERIVLGGLSMGGYVALAFARRHPDRLAGLILADTRAEPDDDAAKANRDKTITLAKDTGATGLIGTMLPKLLSKTTQTTNAGVASELTRIASRQTTAAVVAALQALRDRPDALPGLKAIAVPTLVIVGEEDALTPPAAAETLAGTIPNARLVTIPAAGHMSNLENPSAFNAAVENFLKTIGNP